MLSLLQKARKSLGRVATTAAALALAACVPSGGPSGGPAIDTAAPVPVALLVPAGSGQASPLPSRIGSSGVSKTCPQAVRTACA